MQQDSKGFSSSRKPYPALGDDVAVERCIYELRRGRPVALCDHGNTWLIMAAEVFSAEGVSALADWAEAEPFLIISRQLAFFHGLQVESDDDILIYSLSHLDADGCFDILGIVRHLHNVSMESLGGDSNHKNGAKAVALVKTAELLPAAIMIPCRKRPDELASIQWQQVRNILEGVGIEPCAVQARVPMEAGDAQVLAFRSHWPGRDHLAVIVGQPDFSGSVLVRMHSECFTGDLLGSLRCDCGEQLRGSIAVIEREGGGILLYLSQEGRGIGLINKLKAYNIQDRGIDTVDANVALGFRPDERNFSVGAAILRHIGVDAVRLLTNNPLKVTALRESGINIVERVPHRFAANEHNAGYLSAKAKKAGHWL